MKSLEAAPAIVALRQHVHDIAEHEVLRYRSRLGALSPTQEDALRQMVASLVNRLLHFPTLALKRSAAEDGGGRVDLIREIFGIEAPSQTSSERGGGADASTEPAELTTRRDDR